ncbi:MAG: hypothetical protein LBH01_00955 [Verrucomicrobiales bacterium]|jgi:hypothetical protein|nr:hypothetical protein [Verrucomicrobiales bacterium]
MPEIRIPIPRLPYPILGLSIILHAGLLCLIGSWIINRPSEPRLAPQAFMENTGIVRDEWLTAPPEPEDLPNTESDTSVPTLTPNPNSGANGETVSNFIASAPSAIGVAGSLLPEYPASGGNPGANGEARATKGLSGKTTVGNLFNTRIESAKLGVLLDVSSSAHRYLPLVVSEIERNFSDTVIILTYGCGMYEKVSSDSMNIKEFNRCKPGISGDKNTLGQIAKAAANSEVGNLMKQFQTRRNIYVLCAEDCGHTYYGFKKLLEEKVDTIYWFADFRDKISNRLADKLVKDLNQNGIKVIAHNFSGKPVPEEGEKIALATGGSTIAKIPGNQKK